MNRLTTAPRSAGGGVPADALDMMQGPSDTGLLDRFPADLGKCLVLRMVVVSPHRQAGRQRRGDQRPALGKARPLDAVLLGLVEESAELVKVSDVGLGEPDEPGARSPSWQVSAVHQGIDRGLRAINLRLLGARCALDLV